MNPEVSAVGGARADAQSPDEVFRLKLGLQNGNASTGDWRMFSNRDDFLIALGVALLQSKEPADKVERHLVRAWLDSNGVARSTDAWNVLEVFAAEQFVDGEWVNLDWRLTPPRIEVSAPGQAVAP